MSELHYRLSRLQYELGRWRDAHPWPYCLFSLLIILAMLVACLGTILAGVGYQKYKAFNRGLERIAARLSIAPDDVLETVDSRLGIGAAEEDVVQFLLPLEPEVLLWRQASCGFGSKAEEFASNDEFVRCYEVSFLAFFQTRGFDRYIWFDREGRLIWWEYLPDPLP